MKVTTFNEALAERRDVRRAIMHCLSFPFDFAVSKGEAYDIQAQWVLDNAAAIVEYQSGKQAMPDYITHIQLRDGLEILHTRLNAAVQDSEDRDRVLSRVERDVALLKDENVLANNNSLSEAGWRKFRDDAFGTQTRTPEARKALRLGAKATEPQPETPFNMTEYAPSQPEPTDPNVYGPDDHERAKQHIGKLCYFSDYDFPDYGQAPMKLLAVYPKHRTPYVSGNPVLSSWRKFKLAAPQPVATPEPEPVYKWVGNHYCRDNFRIGTVSALFNGRWAACCETAPAYIDTFATPEKALEWVESQFRNPKTDA